MNLQRDIKTFWEAHPLLDFEIGDVADSVRWAKLDEAKRDDIEKFSQTFWRFDKVTELSVLDIGCGPGWLTVQYAQNQAKVCAVDIAESAVNLTRKALEAGSVSASLQVASAEHLPFNDESFDLVVASGSLHHIPNYKTAFSESRRVTREGGLGLITLYRLGILHNQIVFPFVKLLMRLTGTSHPGSDLARTGTTVENFIRQYDGACNPFGIAKSEKAWRSELVESGWKIVAIERHYFPLRMSKLLRHCPGFVHKFLDKNLSTMIYFTVRR